MRIVQKYDEFNSIWLDVEFDDLHCDDMFRIFDNGERFIDEDGNSLWVAVSEPYVNQYGILTIDTKF